MALNTAFMIAGISGAGAGQDLCYFAQGGVAPTDATTALTATKASAVQTVTVSGTPTGGTLTFGFNGVSTAALAYNVATSALQTALQGLSTIGSGNVTVSGTAGSSYVITFGGALANQSVSTILVTAALTGGTTPDATIAVTTPGSSGWLTAGAISEEGVSKDVKENSKEIRSFGLATSARKIVTSSDITLKLTMQESNTVSVAVYNRKALGSIVPVAGAFSVTDGAFSVASYQMCLEAIDGFKKVRMYCPNVEVTSRDGWAVKNGDLITYGIEATAYPDSSGIAAYTYYVVPGLT